MQMALSIIFNRECCIRCMDNVHQILISNMGGGGGGVWIFITVDYGGEGG